MEKVSAVILNYNTAGETLALYNNVRELDYQNLEIVVVDNASSLRDREQLKDKIPVDCIIFNSKNVGYAGGNNIGLRKAIDDKADFVWILNPDIRVEPDSLKILLRSMQSDYSLAAVGPRILSRENKNKIFTDGEVLDLSNGIHTFHKNHNKPVFKKEVALDYQVDYIDGSSIFLRTTAIKELGFLPEEYFLYWEETDWCTMAKRHNWKLAVNSSAIVYNLNSYKGSNFHYFSNRNKLLFSKKYQLNYREVTKREIQLLFNEVRNRFRGEYLRPYFISRFKGVFSGLLKNALK
jgi:GT2 family glycosyltransferase